MNPEILLFVVILMFFATCTLQQNLWPLPQAHSRKGAWVTYSDVTPPEPQCRIASLVNTISDCKKTCQDWPGCYGIVYIRKECLLQGCTVSPSLFNPATNASTHYFTPTTTGINTENFYFDVSSGYPVLSRAASRYLSIVKKYVISNANKPTTIDFVKVEVSSSSPTPLGQGVDESYSLDVSSTTATITAKTEWGALRALETFTQLVEHTGVVTEIVITDAPSYSYRGVLLDSARHYLPKSSLLSTVDAMAYNKMNVLHWHLSDDQSFPYQSATYPELSGKGAFNNKTHIYNKTLIQDVISYAHDRGIRVIPEFDTPGHSHSWGKGYPKLRANCYQSDGKTVTGWYGINPISKYTETFMSSFYDEISTIFPDKYIHIGADEVSYDCWKSNPEIQKWVKDHNKTDYAEVEAYYVKNILQLVQKHSKSAVVWEDVFDHNIAIPKDTIVDVWKSPIDTVKAIAEKGYKVIWSHPWYLSSISFGPIWRPLYGMDPRGFPGTSKEYDNVIGGMMAMWGEFADGTNMEEKLWANGCAIAERLWSPPNYTNWMSGAEFRLPKQRCRMTSRGIMASPTEGFGWCPHEYKFVYVPPWKRQLHH